MTTLKLFIPVVIYLKLIKFQHCISEKVPNIIFTMDITKKTKNDEMRAEMDNILQETQRYYRTRFNTAGHIQYDFSYKDMTAEFISAGLENLECSRLNAAADVNSKFVAQCLSDSDPDHKVIFNAVGSLDDRAPDQIDIGPAATLKLSQVVRIVANGSNSKVQRARGSRLLFHGTCCYNLVNILNRGLIPSKTGRYGSGVYLTNGINAALYYAKNEWAKVRYVIVSEVTAENMAHATEEVVREGTNEAGQFTKFSQANPPWTEVNLHDSKDRAICKELMHPENAGDVEWPMGFPDFSGDIFVCSEEFVLPAYLLKFDYL